LRPYRTAAQVQNSTWCGEFGQKTLIHIDESTWDNVDLDQTFLTVDDPFQIEHQHTSCELNDEGNLYINVSSMAEYDIGRAVQVSQGLVLSTASATDLACKMVSRDKVGDVLGDALSNDRTCKDLNQVAVDYAMDLMAGNDITSTYDRFKEIGYKIVLKDDKMITIGPQWCLTKLSWKEDAKNEQVTVQSAALLSPITSSIYPGNHYCKLLSPVRVVEWAMSWGLPHNVTRP